MEIDTYLDQMKAIQMALLNLIEIEDDKETLLETLINLLDNQKIRDNQKNLKSFLLLLAVISINHHRSPDFFSYIERILLSFKDDIKKNFKTCEIFKIFENDKRILLFIFEQEIIKPNQSIIQNINDKKKLNYINFFYPEIKEFLNEEETKMVDDDVLNLIKNEQNIFNEKRKIGENDSHICELIRTDSVESFISYVNKTDLPLSGKIKSSIFETNIFLIENKPTLIEYAAFFGSIQIFQYLKMNGVELTPSLWLYAIHSKNAEMINILEENKVKPPDGNYEKCIKESIKCHHNNIAIYIINNLIDENEEMHFNYVPNHRNNFYLYAFQFYNYNLFPVKMDQDFIFCFLCQFGYYTLVNLYLKHSMPNYNIKLI